MKTVSGEVVSSEPVSLSKAARILSKFVSLDSNGASPAFIAYLSRASASFDELSQLHKEHKKSRSHSKVKKQRFDGVDTEGTAESVKIYGTVGMLGKEVRGNSKRKELRGVDKSEGEGVRIDVSLNVIEETRRYKSKNWRDDYEGGRNAVSIEVQKVGGTAMKPKKKKANNEIEAITVEDESCCDHNAIDAIELKNGAKTFDGSEETGKKKERAKHDVAADIVEQEQSSNHSQNDGNETGKIQGDKQKKRKKN